MLLHFPSTHVMVSSPTNSKPLLHLKTKVDPCLYVGSVVVTRPARRRGRPLILHLCSLELDKLSRVT